MKRAYIIFSLALMMVYSAHATPIELDLKPGSFVFAYFNAPGHPELLTPIAKFTHKLDRFSQNPASLTIDLNIGTNQPKLQLDRVIDQYQNYPCRETFKLVDNKGFHFGEGAVINQIKFRQVNDTLVMVQKFKHPSNSRENELVIVVSRSKEAIVQSVKIPASFMLWEWDFRDTFEYLEIAFRGR